ncbi:hypothetical protein AB4Z09_05005 [Rhodococcus sp. TAF43]|uniref:hypothetical protein n=1 Tax=unclassified Rhodococcus (in: high G+C Gram-positive bacteria) TaxID=192944 RepID=UPI000E09E84F|nr:MULTISPECIES: hypothetical protein [unclassified Rhodococcus (in: high G+C Gram-positive bacteria)]QKT13432.1 hypothetical protein HUN07_24245 [Rhodococcus sp. W8901]RDI24845.1 hypothetical protein DEU38_11064 [Rhodococcus sp. AG1013]
MNYFEDDPRNSSGRVHEHPGEAIEDTRNWPGYALVGIGIVTLGMALVAAGYGFQGWAWIAGTICAVSLVVGPVLVLREHRRIKRLDDLGLPDGLGY